MFQWSNFPKSLLDQVKERSKIEEALFPNVSSADVADPEKLRKMYHSY